MSESHQCAKAAYTEEAAQGESNQASQPTFDIAVCGNALIITPRRTLDPFAVEAHAGEIRAAVQLFCEQGLTDIVFDMTRVSRFGSVLLTVLHSLWIQTRQEADHLYVCSQSDFARQVLHVSRFDTIWSLVDSREQALSSCL